MADDDGSVLSKNDTTHRDADITEVMDDVQTTNASTAAPSDPLTSRQPELISTLVNPQARLNTLVNLAPIATSSNTTSTSAST
jgi:hypothetical protein